MMYRYMAVALALLFAAGCAGSIKQAPGGVGETLLWSSASERPGWTVNPGDDSKGSQYFAGVSMRYATEQEARRDAMRDAMDQIIKHSGTLAKDKFERLRVDFGLTSSTIDPTISARELEKYLATNYVIGAKDTEWYIEKWNAPTGVGYNAFVYVKYPQADVNALSKEFAAQKVLEAQRKAKEAADEAAKAQAGKAQELWQKMSKDGFVE